MVDRLLVWERRARGAAACAGDEQRARRFLFAAWRATGGLLLVLCSGLLRLGWRRIAVLPRGRSPMLGGGLLLVLGRLWGEELVYGFLEELWFIFCRERGIGECEMSVLYKCVYNFKERM